MYVPKITIEMKRLDAATANRFYDLVKRLLVAGVWLGIFYLAIQASTEHLYKTTKPVKKVRTPLIEIPKPNPEPVLKELPKP